jgi:hypothetical protein
VERVDGKAAGDHGFITCQRIGLADRARADAIPNAAGGEGGHEAAKPNGVIHRYLFNRQVALVLHHCSFGLEISLGSREGQSG